MAESGATRRLLADSLHGLMSEKPLSAITVGDICARAGMNRKSFYYHFRDKFDLVNWMFYTGFFDRFLAEQEQSPRTDVLLSICRFLDSDRSFWRAAMKTEGQNSLQEYLGDVLSPIMAEHVRQQLPRPEPGQKDLRSFQTELLTCIWRDAIVRWVLGGYELTPEAFVKQLYAAGSLLEGLQPGNDQS